MLNDIVAIRHLLHSHPELSGMEKYAHDILVRYLQALKPTHLHTNVGGYGLVAAWYRSDRYATVAFRADIDALPISETLAVDYRSEQEGVSHKCGHDGHTAILLRLAEVVATERSNVNIVLIFQAEEETGKGATRILESGVLDGYGIDAIYGFHNLPQYSLGSVVLKKGTFAAASVGVAITMVGRQTHAAHPEEGINPAMAVADMIRLMNDYNAAHCSPTDFQQSTLIYTRIGEVAFGTSAGDAELMFTLRAYSNKKMSELLEYMNVRLNMVAKHYGLTLSVDYREPFSAVENTDENVDRLLTLASKQNKKIYTLDIPFRWSEDFAEYLTAYKGAFMGIGAGEDCMELHHPAYDFPDGLIEDAAMFLYSIALSYQLVGGRGTPHGR